MPVQQLSAESEGEGLLLFCLTRSVKLFYWLTSAPTARRVERYKMRADNYYTLRKDDESTSQRRYFVQEMVRRELRDLSEMITDVDKRQQFIEMCNRSVLNDARIRLSLF